MSEWDEDGDRGLREGGNLKRNILIGAAAAGVVIAWMVFARPGDEAPSTRGFDMGFASGGSSSGRPFEARPKTSLDMVSAKIGEAPAGMKLDYLPGSQQPQENQEPEMATSPSVSSGPTAAAAVPGRDSAATPPPPSPADEAKTLAGAGIPTDARGLDNLGAKEGMLSSLAARLLDHPKILAAVFNNKTVVNAFMNRKTVKENCESGGALKSYLSNPNSGGMTKVFPVIQQALSGSNASGLVSALSGTEMAKALGGCPSIKELGNDSSSITSIAMANPKAMGLLMDPRGMAAVAANPQAAGALASLQSKVGGGK